MKNVEIIAYNFSRGEVTLRVYALFLSVEEAFKEVLQMISNSEELINFLEEDISRYLRIPLGNLIVDFKNKLEIRSAVVQMYGKEIAIKRGDNLETIVERWRAM